MIVTREGGRSESRMSTTVDHIDAIVATDSMDELVSGSSTTAHTRRSVQLDPREVFRLTIYASGSPHVLCTVDDQPDAQPLIHWSAQHPMPLPA